MARLLADIVWWPTGQTQWRVDMSEITLEKKATIAKTVLANITALKALDAGGLFRASRQLGYDNRVAFPRFKKALLDAGVDFVAMRAEKAEGRVASLKARSSYQITMFTDAKASKQRFAVCGENGQPLWFGRFFDNDVDFNGEQSTGEMAAAKKAVWLASKIREAVGGDAIVLNLFVDAKWLTYANAVFEGSPKGGSARELGLMAMKYNILLRVRHIPGRDNPADKYTVATGYRRWNENDLKLLAKPFDPAEENDE